MTTKYNNISCAILAGGKSTRIGGINKAFIKIDNEYIIDRIIKTLNKIFRQIIIVTNSPSDFKKIKNKCSIIPDTIKEIGPLGGIYSALSFSKSDAIFFVACDMPYINQRVIEKIISAYNQNNCDAVVPSIGSYIEPLFSVYNKKILSDLSEYIENTDDFSIRRFLKSINVHYLEFKDNVFYKKVFTNINTVEDIP
ncbi:MAG: molybdenum cofactor guanylyltransferase [Bacteroidia bacterium]|nr:molybdenum cofactor guanylyltransferase [Bacteroidia bacterium]